MPQKKDVEDRHWLHGSHDEGRHRITIDRRPDKLQTTVTVTDIITGKVVGHTETATLREAHEWARRIDKEK